MVERCGLCVIGFSGYILPVFLVALGFLIILRGHESIGWLNVLVWSFFFICSVSLIHIFTIDQANISAKNVGFFDGFSVLPINSFVLGQTVFFRWRLVGPALSFSCSIPS